LRRFEAIAGDFQADFQADYLNARMDVSSLYTHIYGLARARRIKYGHNMGPCDDLALCKSWSNTIVYGFRMLHGGIYIASAIRSRRGICLYAAF
jgi:hypothetical protein